MMKDSQTLSIIFLTTVLVVAGQISAPTTYTITTTNPVTGEVRAYTDVESYEFRDGLVLIQGSRGIAKINQNWKLEIEKQ